MIGGKDRRTIDESSGPRLMTDMRDTITQAMKKALKDKISLLWVRSADHSQPKDRDIAARGLDRLTGLQMTKFWRFCRR